MAKEAKAEKATKRSAPPRPDAKAEFKYTVDNLAKDLDLQPASVRVALRKHDIDKDGGVYGWNSKDEYQEVLGILREPVKSADKPKPKVKAAGTEKPVAKAKAKVVPKKKAA